MSEKNECGKVIDVTSNLGGFIPKNDEKDTKKGKGRKHVHEEEESLPLF